MNKRKMNNLRPKSLQQFGFDYAPPLIVSATVNNKVFDALQNGPKTVDQVKKEAGAARGGLRAIMDSLISCEQ
jgi:hypothetical protein